MKHIFLACVAWWAASAAAEEARVAVTIKPLHSLVAAVMEGDAEPQLIVSGNALPHGFQLKPSQARALERADIVFAIGAGLEPFLPDGERVVKMANQPGIFVLPVRGGEDAPPDPHLWMDPTNAATMVDVIALQLGAHYPRREALYKSNAARLKERISEVDEKIRALLGKGHLRFIVFHDALQYFERAYGVQAASALTVARESSPGARHLSRLRALLREGEVGCVLTEPQYQGRLVEQLVQDTDARVGMMDPEGVSLEAGPEMYLKLLAYTAEQIGECTR